MIKNRINFALGLIVALLPFSGFLPEWKTIFYVVIGLTIALFSWLNRSRLHDARTRPTEKEVGYVENKKEGDARLHHLSEQGKSHTE